MEQLLYVCTLVDISDSIGLCISTSCIQILFYDLFLTSFSGRNVEDIDLRFFVNCRIRMLYFFLYATCGHLFFL